MANIGIILPWSSCHKLFQVNFSLGEFLVHLIEYIWTGNFRMGFRQGEIQKEGLFRVSVLQILHCFVYSNLRGKAFDLSQGFAIFKEIVGVFMIRRGEGMQGQPLIESVVAGLSMGRII